jgi:hypothetical protein
MTESTGSDRPDPDDRGPDDRGPDDRGMAEEPAALSFSEAFAAAARRSGIGQVTPGETPTASSLLKAIGGVRGLVESILPGLGFLVIYTITQQLLPSVIVPLVIAVIFIIVRAVSRSAVMPAIAGFIGVGVSAALALITGRAEDNFIPGIIINIVCIVVLLTSIVVRWPFIGVIAGFLTNDSMAWRADKAKFRVVLVATWCWVGLFALRLAVEVPLYLASQTGVLASMKLILGVPLYAAMLWVTWLLVRSAFGHESAKTASTE